MTAGEESHNSLELTGSCPEGFAPHLDVRGAGPWRHSCHAGPGLRQRVEGAAPQAPWCRLPSPQGVGKSQAQLKNTSSAMNTRDKLWGRASDKSSLPSVSFYCHGIGKKKSVSCSSQLPPPPINCCIIQSKNTDRTNQHILWKSPFALTGPWSKAGEVMKYVHRHLLLAVYKTK